MEFVTNKISNSEWKVHVDFRDIAIEEMEKFRKDADEIIEKEKSMPTLKKNVLGPVNSRLTDRKQFLAEQKKKLKKFMD